MTQCIVEDNVFQEFLQSKHIKMFKPADLKTIGCDVWMFCYRSSALSCNELVTCAFHWEKQWMFYFYFTGKSIRDAEKVREGADWEWSLRGLLSGPFERALQHLRFYIWSQTGGWWEIRRPEWQGRVEWDGAGADWPRELHLHSHNKELLFTGIWTHCWRPTPEFSILLVPSTKSKWDFSIWWREEKRGEMDRMSFWIIADKLHGKYNFMILHILVSNIIFTNEHHFMIL